MSAPQVTDGEQMLPSPILRTVHLFLKYNLRKTTSVKAKRKFLRSFHNKEKI